MKATTCKVCGKPRNTRPGTVGRMMLCEEHLREYWRTKEARREMSRETPISVAARRRALWKAYRRLGLRVGQVWARVTS